MRARRHELVLAVYPNTRGFAFVVFEGPLALFDWGVFETRGKDKNRRCIRKLARIIGQCQPALLVLQDAEHARRQRRVVRLTEAMTVYAETQGIAVAMIDRQDVRRLFGGSASKHTIAQAICRRIPILSDLLPPVRRPWQSEHPRMGLFDAAALAFAVYSQQPTDGQGPGEGAQTAATDC